MTWGLGVKRSLPSRLSDFKVLEKYCNDHIESGKI